VVPAPQQGRVGVEDEVAAARPRRGVEPRPQLAVTAEDEGLAVEGRPDLAVGLLAADLGGDLLPQAALHVPLRPRHLLVAAVHAAQVAVRGVLDDDLRREGVLAQAGLDGQQAGAIGGSEGHSIDPTESTGPTTGAPWIT